MRRRAITAQAEAVLGEPVGVAVPVQRHPPHLMLTTSGLELAAFATLALTASLAALAAVAACATVLLGLALTNRKRVLAVGRSGVTVLTADLRAHPLAPAGPAPEAFRFPDPTGVGAPADLDDGRWWVDRAHYARLRRARELTSASG